jgi:hypothetical protein
MVQDVRAFDLHIVIKPDPEFPERWLAHCLELDVETWADSFPQAREMIREAIELVLVDDLAKRRDPLLRRAPQEDWDEMWAKLQSLRGKPAREAEESETPYLVIETTVRVAEITGERPPAPPEFVDHVAFAPELRAK